MIDNLTRVKAEEACDTIPRPQTVRQIIMDLVDTEIKIMLVDHKKRFDDFVGNNRDIDQNMYLPYQLTAQTHDWCEH